MSGIEKTILIIDDNLDTRRFLEAMLSKKFKVKLAENALIGLEMARAKAPDLIILDIVLPILSGIDACSLLKKDERTRRVPIIILSIKNTQADIKAGLAIGADEYITKPFDFDELQKRIELRIETSIEAATDKPIQLGSIVILPSTREVSCEGQKIKLTLTEFDILRLLATKIGQVVSREDILREVWRDESPKTNDRTIDVHVRALRKKIPPLTKHIISIYGVGYRFEK